MAIDQRLQAAPLATLPAGLGPFGRLDFGVLQTSRPADTEHRRGGRRWPLRHEPRLPHAPSTVTYTSARRRDETDTISATDLSIN